MKIIRKHVKTILYLTSVWTLAGLAVGGGIAVTAESSRGGPGTIVAYYLCRYYVWGLLASLIYVFARRYQVRTRPDRFRNIALNLVVGLSVTGLHALIFEIVTRLALPQYAPEGQTFLDSVLRTLPVSFVFTFVTSYIPTIFAVESILFLQNLQAAESKNTELRIELSKAQLNALKMQLHPHFLFNSLHAVSSLILVDPARANRMIALLGDFLRQTLDHSSDQIVPLEQEIEFLHSYLAIEEVRFSDRLTVEFDIDSECLTVGVPHLILQPIVENAVKHGIAPFAEAGKIVVRARKLEAELMLEITDSGKKLNNPSQSDVITENGVGLSNVRSRLRSLYGNNASLHVRAKDIDGFHVMIKLPLESD